MHHTALHDHHIKNGGKVVDFHGWALPIQFNGIIEEHVHTRTKVSLFDCSHMGEFLVKGTDAIAALEQLGYRNLIGLRVGRCRYSAILNTCGGIIDDIVAMRLSDDEMYVVTNAGPLETVSPMLKRSCGACDLSSSTAKIDVQGPLSRDVLLRMGFSDIDRLKFYTVCKTQWQGQDIIISRSGYTGELGYELFIPNDLAEPLWSALLQFEEVAPAGLGARDTLRLEMGYPLYGQDIDTAHTALESGFGAMIDWTVDFIAHDYLQVQQETDRYPVRVGIRSKSRRAPRQGYVVYANGMPVGEVTSGCYGPSVGCGVGMAYVPIELSRPGTPLTCGPKDMEIETALLPFYQGATGRS